jgi:ABC-2 type transport system permease protein
MSSVRRMFRVYARMMKVHWAILLEYRGDTFFYMVGSFIYPLVTLAVWLTISADGAVGGYEQRDFILYFLVVLFISRLAAYWDPWEMETLMREGTLSNYLLRPSAFFHWRFSENLVYKLFYGALMIAAWALAWPFFEAVRIPLEPVFLLASFSSVVLAVMIRYMMGFCLSLLAFWTTRMLAIVNLVMLTDQFISGRIAPYELLPDWVQQVSGFLPFYWTMGFPVEVITGKVTGEAVLFGLGVQAFWQALFIALYFVMWNRGIRKYSAVGG